MCIRDRLLTARSSVGDDLVDQEVQIGQRPVEFPVGRERHLDEETTVEQLAARAHMSPRTFARRFQQETGTTPYRWILRQRVLLAQRLLEATDETVDAIAGRTGFGNAAALRHHFVRAVGTTPQVYRRTFRRPPGP